MEAHSASIFIFITIACTMIRRYLSSLFLWNLPGKNRCTDRRPETTLIHLHAVRAKTGKDNSLSGTVDINTILDERAIELCGEQQRWFDLKRTRTLVSRVKAYNAQGGGNVKDFHYYRPIPQAELDAITNPGEFKQNDGYN